MMRVDREDWSNSAIKNGMAPQKVFHLRCPVVAVLKMDYPWRRTAGNGEADEVGVSRHNGKPMFSRKLPDQFIRAEADQPGVEYMVRAWK